MKAFSLDEYRENPSKKVVTRDGESVRIICTDYYGEKPIIAKIEECEYSYPFYEDGKFLSYGEPSHLDLFFAPEKHEGWLNIYRSNECGFYMRGESPYKSKDEADKVAKVNPKTFFTTIKVEWEE